MRNIATFVALIAGACVLPACASETHRYNICELSTNGPKLNGRLVSFEATYITDMRHGSVFKDSRCPEVVVGESSGPEKPHPSIEKFDVAVKGDPFNRELRVFRIKASGIFNWSKSSNASGVLILKQVESYSKASLPIDRSNGA